MCFIFVLPFRDALTKMKDVYIKNPQMGDAASVDHRLAELGQNIEKLRLEVQKFEVNSVKIQLKKNSKKLLRSEQGLPGFSRCIGALWGVRTGAPWALLH